MKPLPHRPFDEAAKATFIDIIKRLEREAANSKDDCWLWPKAWPVRWGAKPDGYSVSHTGEGYGRLTLTKTKQHSSAEASAHKLAFIHYNLRRDITLTDPEFAQADWAGGDVRGLHVRHDNKCISRACVNPWHLSKGPPCLNRLDKAWKDHCNDTLPPDALNHRQCILNAFDTPDFDGIAKRLKAHGIKPWHIVKIIKDAELPWEWLFDDAKWLEGK